MSAGKKAKPVILALLLAAIAASVFLLPVKEYLTAFLDWVQGVGTTGIIAFIGAYVLACVFFIPGSLLTLGAGFAFGVLWGTIAVSAGSVLGAAAAFLLGRTLLRGTIESKVEGNAKFSAIDQAVEKNGAKMVLLTRLSPVFPFNLLNYAFGLTKVSFTHYFFASWIGMLPGTVMYVYIGSLAGSLAAAGDRAKSPAEWALYVVGLIATIAVTVMITKIAKKALNEAAPESELKEAEASA